MIPILVEGKSIAEVWENALIALYHTHHVIKTEYDYNPLTDEKDLPSIDCPMIMYVEDPNREPRLHCCLEGGPAELAEYTLEVVHGIKNHWVKTHPDGKEWSYTYNGRLTNYGSNMNFASIIKDGPIDENNPWTELSYVRKIDGELHYEVIPPMNQIQHIIDTLVEAPHSRRAVASTTFPPADLLEDSPPCLRTITCRGFYKNNCLKINMNVHFRSRDAFGAALFNMIALVELQKYITHQIQEKLNQKYTDGTLDIKTCPKCGGELMKYLRGYEGKPYIEEYPSGICCAKCYLAPYDVKVGSYTDFSDSFHLYGRKLNEFEDRFINSAIKQPKERRFWDISTPDMQELWKEGEEKAYKMVAELDKKNNKTNFPRHNQDMSYKERMWDLSAMEDIKREGREKAYAMIRSLDEKNDKVDFPLYNNDI